MHLNWGGRALPIRSLRIRQRTGDCAVIIAVGAKAAVPPIKGIETAVPAVEAYLNIDKIGERVVLVGGDW